jgi:hypothetical protein
MAQHKWHKEIKAWADGAEIEQQFGETWAQVLTPSWHRDTEYRIKPQHTFKAMCEIPYKKWVLRFYQMPNDLWYSEGMDDAWMKEMVEASKPQPKEPQYLYVYGNEYVTVTSIEKAGSCDGVPYLGKIKLEVDDD